LPYIISKLYNIRCELGKEVFKVETEVESLTCGVGDKVYVYKKKLFKGDFTLDSAMFGEIIDLEQRVSEDYMNMEQLHYTATIKLQSGKTIIIEDEFNMALFRKYDFITLKELREMLEEKSSQLQVCLHLIGDISS
jgi:ATP:corrinoid adenosyltransferase